MRGVANISQSSLSSGPQGDKGIVHFTIGELFCVPQEKSLLKTSKVPVLIAEIHISLCLRWRRSPVWVLTQESVSQEVFFSVFGRHKTKVWVLLEYNSQKAEGSTVISC